MKAVSRSQEWITLNIIIIIYYSLDIYLMKYDISIIIPAFNVEKTLARAINSSLEQSNINPEIIIINDESTDKSGVIADSYSHHYKNIKNNTPTQ